MVCVCDVVRSTDLLPGVIESSTTGWGRSFAGIAATPK